MLNFYFKVPVWKSFWSVFTCTSNGSSAWASSVSSSSMVIVTWPLFWININWWHRMLRKGELTNSRQLNKNRVHIHEDNVADSYNSWSNHTQMNLKRPCSCRCSTSRVASVKHSSELCVHLETVLLSHDPLSFPLVAGLPSCSNALWGQVSPCCSPLPLSQVKINHL